MVSGGIFIGQNDDDESIKTIIERGYRVVLVDQSVRPDDVTYNQCTIVNADNYVCLSCNEISYRYET